MSEQKIGLLTNGVRFGSDREDNDFYATDPVAVERLLEVEKFTNNILEPCSGLNHIVNVLRNKGYDVRSTDVIDRGCQDEIRDIFEYEKVGRDIITNPPYKDCLKYVEKMYDMLEEGHKMALLLKLTFLEGQSRKKFFEEHPFSRLWVHSKRISCMINGREDKKNGCVAYGWYIWEKDYKGESIVKWL